MLGAILGDIVGSRHEFNPIKTTDFEFVTNESRWTDDTVCTIAVEEAILTDGDFEESLVRWVNGHKEAGFGLNFLTWAITHDREPYGSWGNGSAMRTSPAAWLSSSISEAARIAAEQAAPSHNHHHGIRGSVAVAVATRMALEGWPKAEIKSVLEDRYGYNLSRTPDDIRPGYSFKVSCQRSVPEAICCFLASQSYEESIRLCVSLGGDADTQAAIAGSIAEPMFGLPLEGRARALGLMNEPMRAVHALFEAKIAGKIFEKTDPGILPRDIPPPREGKDPMKEPLVAEKMTQIEAAQRV